MSRSRLLCVLSFFTVFTSATAVSAAASVERFATYEVALRQQGGQQNPYKEITATVNLKAPGGERTLPMFWDGGDLWKFRVSPDEVGAWSWTVRSNDPGLEGKSGTFSVVPSKRRGGLRAMKEAPYHFQREDGSPFWFIGDTAWVVFTNNEEEKHDRARAQQYIARRAAQGFNVVHSMLIAETGWQNDGGPPFLSLSEERINPAYWQEIDRRLAFINGKGITVGLALAWAQKARPNPNSWKNFPSQDARKRYARYATARYAAHDVYFLVAGEWNMQGFTDENRRTFIELGQVVDESDPHGRMIGIHPGGPGANGSVREFQSAPWMSFSDYQQLYPKMHAGALASRTASKPVVNSEYGYHLRDFDGDGSVDKDNSASTEDMRFATWDIVMAGAYVITGFGATYFGGDRDPGNFEVAAPKHRDWERQIGQVKRVFESLEWWKLEPSDELISTASFVREDDGQRKATRDNKELQIRRPPARTYWALAEKGRQYLAYARGGKTRFELALGEGVEARLRLRRIDPRTGKATDLGTKKRSGTVSLDAPDDRDWVFVLTSAEVRRAAGGGKR